jgi:hypothetical protein
MDNYKIRFLIITMPKWEYMTYVWSPLRGHAFEDTTCLKVMSAFGMEGWEAVCHIPFTKGEEKEEIKEWGDLNYVRILMKRQLE